MTKTRNLSDLLDNNGDVKLANLDNVPASNDASALTTGTLPIARIAGGDITLDKLSATGTKDSTTFLRGDNTFASAGGANTPAFEACINSNQSATSAVTTKMQFSREIYDTDSCYDNATNYRFTPTTAGKYFVYISIYGGVGGVSRLSQFALSIKKNGTTIADQGFDNRTSALTLDETIFFGTVIDFNGSTDYVEGFAYINDTSSFPVTFYGSATISRCRFGAYRIIE